MSEQGPLEPGRRVGDYVVESEIGGGGMARVYRVRHAILDTWHALKVLEPQYRAVPLARQRFLDEARIQARMLDHRNVVKVTNIVATEEVAALVMELVDGPTLEEYIASVKGPAPAADVRALMIAILAGVGHAHRQGIIHRDIKPANILLAPQYGGGWVPKVTDFGIAKVTQEAGEAKPPGKKSTLADARMGTLSYMSPEQIRKAKEVTTRSDVFSLGAVLYELATGTVAFEGESDFDVMDNIVRGRYPRPETRAPGLDPTIAAAIAGALQPDPAARFPTCEALAEALRSSDKAARDAGKSAPGIVTRRRVSPLALLVAALLGATPVVIWGLLRDRPTVPARPANVRGDAGNLR